MQNLVVFFLRTICLKVRGVGVRVNCTLKWEKSCHQLLQQQQLILLLLVVVLLLLLLLAPLFEKVCVKTCKLAHCDVMSQGQWYFLYTSPGSMILSWFHLWDHVSAGLFFLFYNLSKVRQSIRSDSWLKPSFLSGGCGRCRGFCG